MTDCTHKWVLNRCVTCNARRGDSATHYDRLMADNKALREQLLSASCPDNCSNGMFVRQIEAGVFEQDQCEWCYQRWQLTKSLPT